MLDALENTVTAPQIAWAATPAPRAAARSWHKACVTAFGMPNGFSRGKTVQVLLAMLMTERHVRHSLLFELADERESMPGLHGAATAARRLASDAPRKCLTLCSPTMSATWPRLFG
jgi:hypothetical protein